MKKKAIAMKDKEVKIKKYQAKMTDKKVEKE